MRCGWFALVAVMNIAAAWPEEDDTEIPHFVIIVPSYNNKQWVRRNLYSLLMQRYQNFRIVYIDDASKDGTGEAVHNYLQCYDTKGKVSLIRSTQRRGQLAHIYAIVHECDKNDIIVIVDGDDWLLHPYVLHKLSKVYTQKKVLITYGQFMYFSHNRALNRKIGFARRVPEHIVKNNRFRYYGWIFTHLRTFKAGLFQKIRLKDLLYHDYFYRAATDLVAMYPMLEMAGPRHAFIEEPLYVYNIDNPHRTDMRIQRALGKKIKKKKPYKVLSIQDHEEHMLEKHSIDTIIVSANPDNAAKMRNLVEASKYADKVLIMDSDDLEVLKHLKEFIQQAHEFILMITDDVIFTSHDITTCGKFMHQSHADICYINPVYGIRPQLDVLPHFYSAGAVKHKEASCILTKKLLLKNIQQASTVSEVLATAGLTDNAFMYCNS